MVSFDLDFCPAHFSSLSGNNMQPSRYLVSSTATHLWLTPSLTALGSLCAVRVTKKFRFISDFQSVIFSWVRLSVIFAPQNCGGHQVPRSGSMVEESPAFLGWQVKITGFILIKGTQVPTCSQSTVAFPNLPNLVISELGRQVASGRSRLVCNPKIGAWVSTSHSLPSIDVKYSWAEPRGKGSGKKVSIWKKINSSLNK